MQATRERPRTQEEAQQEADRIRAFGRELERLELAGVLHLAPEQRDAIHRDHEARLVELGREFDIDRTDAEKQMSLGMRIASFVGALAFSLAVFLFFYRFWGALSVPLQVAILLVVPLVATLGVHVAARLDRTGYFASLLGLVALACFVLDLSVLAGIFNMRPSPHSLLAWGAFAVALAYGYGLTWVLFAGGVALAAWLTAGLAGLAGASWTVAILRPEGLVLAGLAALGLSVVEFRRGSPAFGGVYRFLGWTGLLFPMLFLSQEASLSYVPVAPTAVTGVYLAAGFLLGGYAVWTGIRGHSRVVMHTATLFLALLLFTKLFDWWWDWMPRYLFFFLLGLIAVAILVLLRRVRARVWQV